MLGYIHAYAANSGTDGEHGWLDLHNFKTTKANIMLNYNAKMNEIFKQRVEASFTSGNFDEIIDFLGLDAQNPNSGFAAEFQKVWGETFSTTMTGSQPIEEAMEQCFLRWFGSGRNEDATIAKGSPFSGKTNKYMFENHENLIQPMIETLKDMIKQAEEMQKREQALLLVAIEQGGYGHFNNLNTKKLIDKDGMLLINGTAAAENIQTIYRSYKDLKELNDELHKKGSGRGGQAYIDRLDNSAIVKNKEGAIFNAFSGLASLFIEYGWKCGEIMAEQVAAEIQNSVSNEVYGIEQVVRGGAKSSLVNIITDPALKQKTLTTNIGGTQSEDVSIVINNGQLKGVIGVQVKNYSSIDLVKQETDFFHIGQRKNLLNAINYASAISGANTEAMLQLGYTLASSMAGNKYQWTTPMILEQMLIDYFQIVGLYNMLEFVMGKSIGENGSSNTTIGNNNLIYAINGKIFTVQFILQKALAEIQAGNVDSVIHIYSSPAIGSIRTKMVNDYNRKPANDEGEGGGAWQEKPEDKQKRSDIIVNVLTSELTKATMYFKMNFGRLLLP